MNSTYENNPRDCIRTGQAAFIRLGGIHKELHLYEDLIYEEDGVSLVFQHDGHNGHDVVVTRGKPLPEIELNSRRETHKVIRKR